MSELRVAGGIPTSVTFPAEIHAEQVLLADNHRRFFDPQVTGRTLVLVPKTDLKAHETVALHVTLADGALIPFVVTTVPTEADLAVDVELALTKRVAPESVRSLKASVGELQGRLDECQSTAAEQGLAKVAALVLAQDPTRPEAFTVERHAVRHLDRQSRLLVETKTVYRLFDVSYLVLTVENRDPSHAWVLERAEVVATGGTASTEARVVSVAQELAAIPSGETGRLVIALGTPVLETGQAFTVRLFEKGGNRHVSLDGLRL